MCFIYTFLVLGVVVSSGTLHGCVCVWVCVCVCVCVCAKLLQKVQQCINSGHAKQVVFVSGDQHRREPEVE